MPVTSFTPENKAKVGSQYPKLTLENGERARIVVIENQPIVEYYHVLRAPQVINGQVVKEEVRAKDGSVSMKVKEDFMGQHLCLGEFQTLESKGVDPDNCPTCRAAVDHPDMVSNPQTKYAVHVIRYATMPGSFNLAEPFGVALLGWSFGPSKWNKLIELQGEWGDLKQRDLLLGPCESKQFQKFDIGVAAGCEWIQDQDRQRHVAQTYQSQKGDLTPLIGRRLQRQQIEDDILKTKSRYQAAYGNAATAATSIGNTNEQAGAVDLGSLLGDAPAQAQAPQQQAPQQQAPAQAAPQAPAPDMGALLGDQAQAPAQAPQQAAPQQEQAPQQQAPQQQAPAPAQTGEALDLDDLLNGIG